MTRIALAFSVSGHSLGTLAGFDWDRTPLSLLVSYVFLPQYRREAAKRGYRPDHLMLDSGAFSAWKSGKTIDLDALIAETLSPDWDETVALDVIGDARGSLENALAMKARGSPAYPVFHVGEPWEILAEYCAHFPKVGLSCRFGEPESTSLEFLSHCFARHWPHRFHSFGWTKESMLMAFPFESADTSSWVTAPAAWGKWRSFGQLPTRGPKTVLAEIDWFLRLEERLKARWARTLTPLAPPKSRPGPAPTPPS